MARKRKISRVRKNLYQQAYRWQKRLNASMEAGIGNIYDRGSAMFEFSKVSVTNRALKNLTTAQIRKVIKTLKTRASGEVVRITVNEKFSQFVNLLDDINPEAAKAVVKMMKGKSLKFKMLYMLKNKDIFTSIWNSDQILEHIRKNDMFDKVEAMDTAIVKN